MTGFIISAYYLIKINIQSLVNPLKMLKTEKEFYDWMWWNAKQDHTSISDWFDWRAYRNS